MASPHTSLNVDVGLPLDSQRPTGVASTRDFVSETQTSRSMTCEYAKRYIDMAKVLLDNVDIGCAKWYEYTSLVVARVSLGLISSTILGMKTPKRSILKDAASDQPPNMPVLPMTQPF